MYARVPQAMAQFALKIEKLSHIMGTAPILEIGALTVSVPDYGSSLGFKATFGCPSVSPEVGIDKFVL